MLYEMSTGKSPFEDTQIGVLIDHIVNIEITFPKFINDQLKSLLKTMLEKDPEKRGNWNDIVRHPFFQNKIKHNDFSFPENLSYNDYLKNRSTVPKTKKVDIMRLSQNVARNNLKTENYENYDNSEMKFVKNQVIDFEEKNIENEDDNDDNINNDNNNNNNININKNDIEIPQIRNKTEPNNNEENDVIFASETSNSHYVNNQNKNDKKPVEFINFTLTIQNKNIQIENLVTNVHDTTVKPIIGNKDIEN